jgi:nitroreductase
MRLTEIIRHRHSARGPFDPDRRVSETDLRLLLQAARWAPTAHNMQNFEIVVVDDPGQLVALGAIETRPDPVFLEENLAQLAFSEEELRARGTGIPAAMFPPAWREPGADFAAVAAAAEPGSLDERLQGAPCVLVVLRDETRRAPASEGDVLGFISLGCVMQNLWLMAQSLGLGLQVLSSFASPAVERETKRILGFPDPMVVAFACRLGYPMPATGTIRVRRPLAGFVWRNRYGTRLEPAKTLGDPHE